MAEAEETVETDEDVAKRERDRRRRAALRAGLDEEDAEWFSVGDTPIATLRHCVRRGATVEQIVKIVV